MAISGPIKFFKKNYADIDNDGATASVSSGGDTRDAIRDRRRHTRWESAESDDLTAETVTIDFGDDPITIDRLILRRHNWKAFNVQYWNGSAWTHFANVVTKEGTQTNITETVSTKSTSYYEFTAVSAYKVRCTVTTTQTVDAEKYLYELVITEEIGTLTGYPVHQADIQTTKQTKQSPGGRLKFTLFDEIYSSTLTFVNYGVAADHAIIKTLYEIDAEFLIWPCGGNEAQFRFPTAPHRLQDIYLVSISSGYAPNYTQNVYVLGLNYTIGLTEVA